MRYYYKVLQTDNNSPYMLFQWSLPQFIDNQWQAGEWHEVTGDIVLCENGLHVCNRKQLKAWAFANCDIYEAECEGDSVSDDRKSAFRRVRLLRLVSKIRNKIEVQGNLFSPVITVTTTTAATNGGLPTSTVAYKLVGVTRT